MFTEEFFRNQLRKEMDDFTKETGSPAIPQFTLTDGWEFRVRRYEDRKGWVYIEAVCEDEEGDEENHLLYVPYDAIRYVELLQAV